MIWTIASIPLWIIGLALLGAPVRRVVWVGWRQGNKLDQDDLSGCLIALILSAFFLILAAKVAS